MNDIFDFFNRFFTVVCNVYVVLLQNGGSYMIAMMISYIRLQKNNTEQNYTVNRVYTLRYSNYERLTYEHLLVNIVTVLQ
jgi:hypothetical protein